MKRLAELKGIEAVKAAGVIGGAIGTILRNEKNNIEDITAISMMQMLSLYVQNNPEEMGKILSALTGRDETEEGNAAVLVSELFQLATDPDLIFFFTLPYQKQARKQDTETTGGQE